MERILCAAIHVQNDFVYREQPLNIERGIVICGRRHNNCYGIAEDLIEDLWSKPVINGFITSEDRFVTREEGYEIAVAAGQCKPVEDTPERRANQKWLGIPEGTKPILISEMLY